jgi:dephospho-CoA kinase
VDLDEKVTLSEWRPQWSRDFGVLAEELTVALGGLALRIDHIGSTSVPGLPAKDVIDVQVIVGDLDRDSIIGAMGTIQFECSDREWNYRDHIPAGWIGDPGRWSKLVFAPPPGARASNVHVRVAGAPNERYALLFRDFLRADDPARVAWARFKTQLAENTSNVAEYGMVKDPATDLLLALAERWAEEVGWTVPEHRTR